MHRSKRKILKYEIQVFESGETSEMARENCKKLENHKDYIEVSQLRTHLLDKDLYEFIFIRCLLTVLIQVPTDSGRSLCGSGFIQKIEIINDLPCPCPICKGKEAVKVYAKVTVSTALHVLENEEDADKCTVRLFYDSPNESEETLIYGLKSHSRDKDGDWCALVCVCHDIDMLKYLSERLDKHWKIGRALKDKYKEEKNNMVIVVSHPHGGPKRVSIGKAKIKDKTREVRDEQDWCYYSYDAVTCSGSSGGCVYVLGRWIDGLGYWFGHAHNHSGVDNRTLSGSTVGVDSTHGKIAKSFSSITIDDVEDDDNST